MASHPNEIWTLDFLSDRLLHGRVFRALTLLDECSRYGFAVDPDFSYPSVSVVRKLEETSREHGYPKCLRVDNGPEFIASALEVWAHEHTVELLFIQPGKPTLIDLGCSLKPETEPMPGGVPTTARIRIVRSMA